MAGTRACPSFYQNFSLIGKDELAGSAPTKGNSTPTPTSVISRASTPVLTTASAVTLSSHNKLFMQFMKAYLEAQVPSQTKVDPEPRKQSFKTQFLEL